MASPSEVTSARARFYRVIGRSLGIKIAALLVFFALLAYLGGH